MRPLIYLTVKSTVNGVRRALTSGKRLISLLFVIGYWFMVFLRPISGGRGRGDWANLPATRLELPPLDVIQAIVFGAFSAITLLLMLGVFGYRGSFKPADVDVLFPTPVNPRLVLVFRMFRDYLVTLLLPLFLAVFGYRPAANGLGYLFRNLKNPDALNQMLRWASVAWLLVALTWVSIGYASSLFVNRSDLGSNRNRRIMTWSLVGIILFVAVYVFAAVRQLPDWHAAVSLARDPVLRVVFFSATAATTMVMGPLQENPTMTAVGAGTLMLIIVAAIQVAMTQVGWMYDQAAARGFDTANLRQLQRRGDSYAIFAQQARSGKLKAGRRWWIHRLAIPGPAALVWKEAIIQLRSSVFVLVLFLPVVLIMMAVPLFASPADNVRVSGAMLIGSQAFGVFIMSMNFAQTGFIEVLRRVDLQKPLPFTSATTVTMEVIAKTLPSFLVVIVTSIVALVARPGLWQEALGGVILMPFLGTLICAAVFLVTILFPDVDDPTQRGFRGLMILLATAIAGSPGVLVFATLYGFGASAIIAAFVTAALYVGITAGIATIAGGQYASYNPSE